jgi:serine-type D-Ala-D-Ala carboxypeptidase
MMKNSLIFCILILALSACGPKVKTGYVEVPTVTKNALSGVKLLEPDSPTARLYYEEAGAGEPLILLHAHSVDCRMWDPQFFKLAKKFRVIRYDLRGYGKSDMPEVGQGFLQADDLKNFMDALGIKKAHFAGLSLGGMTLTDFVALYPECVLSATITAGALSAFPNRLGLSKDILKLYNDTIFALKEQDVVKMKSIGLEESKKEWKTAIRSMSGEHYRDISKKLNGMIDDWKAWQWLNPETDAFIGLQADSLLAKQKKHPRILILIGQYDAVGSKKSMQRLAALCPEAKIQLLPEAGHFSNMESPDEFLEKMEAFILRLK